MKKIYKLVCSAFLVVSTLSAQDKWDTDGNNLPLNNKFGSKNNRTVNIFTNDVKRGEFTKEGKFNFYGALKADSLRADTLVINGGARIKGRLHVGQNSMWLGGSGPTFTDDITSTNGVVNIGGEPTVPLPFSQIKVGIGTQLPQFNVHIVDNRTPSNRIIQGFANFNTGQTSSDGFQMGIFGNGNANLNQQELNKPITLTTAGGFVGVSNTNLLFNPTSLFHVSDGANQTDMQVTNNSTGITATDGFKLGITNTGIAQVKQQENLDMQFYTNNLQRAIILANGRFGINASTPLNRFEVTSAATDFGGGNVLTPGGSSGIRTTNMTASTPITIGNGKVVSVNANGDFILVKDDNSGTGGGTATAQNGLNHTVGAPFIELGGNLIRHTDVVFNNFNQSWKGSGSFLVTDYASGANSSAANASGIYKQGIFNSNFNKSLQIQHVRSAPTLTKQDGILIEMDVDNNSAFSTNGTSINILGDAGTANGVLINVNARNYSQATSSLLNAYGVNAVANNAYFTTGGSFTAQSIVDGPPNSQSVGVYAIGIGGKRAFGSIVDVVGGALSNIGVFVKAINQNPSTVGVLYQAIKATSDTKNTGGINYGIDAAAQNDGTGSAYAVRGSLTSGVTSYQTGIAAHVSVYGDAQDYASTLGSPSAIPAATGIARYAGFFDGNVEIVNGTFTMPGGAGAIITGSDQNLKTNIDTITNALNTIKQLKPKQFYMDTVGKYFLKKQSKKCYGLIAQDVQILLPELVTNFVVPNIKDSANNIIAQGGSYKGLNYNAFIGILIKGMQEQQRTIDSIRTVLNTPSGARMGNTSNNQNTNSTATATALNKQNVTLSNVDALVLDQNQPNPFSESTIIKYNVPKTYNYAQLIFTTEEGRILKTVDIA